MKGQPFTCAACGGTFDQGWSDDEAAAEARARFGADPTRETMDVVCDDCYAAMEKFFRWPALPQPERRKIPRPPPR